MLEKDIRGYERQFYIQRLVAAMLAVAENAGLSVNQVLADRQANLFERSAGYTPPTRCRIS